MNRRDLVKAVAAHVSAEAKQVDTVLKGFQEVVTAVVSKGEPVSISGFAKFAKVERPARMGRNPATGESIRIKASKKARITPMKAFKDAVMTPSQAPKLARGIWPVATTPAKAAPAKSTRASTAKAAPAKAPAKAPARTTAKTATKAGTAAKKTAAKSTTTARKAPARSARG
ncbi:MAG TPA: HU family DNA-binding protein [Acidimicrobiales bacterium]|nr:HU family DNA-binding protein [Acidimicrobiales bacterium]